MPGSSLRYIRHRPVREERMDDVLFLIDEEGHAIHMLDTIGMGIWALLAEPTSVADAKSVLKTAFPGVSAQRIARDADALFADLDAAELIKHVS
ncbi:MAG: PqqD family protein [Rhizobium sp.]|nr:PqqD family protein [Rhizobium sp.]